MIFVRGNQKYITIHMFHVPVLLFTDDDKSLTTKGEELDIRGTADSLGLPRTQGSRSIPGSIDLIMHLIVPFDFPIPSSSHIDHECRQQRHTIRRIEIISILKLPHDEAGKEQAQRSEVDYEHRHE